MIVTRFELSIEISVHHPESSLQLKMSKFDWASSMKRPFLQELNPAPNEIPGPTFPKCYPQVATAWDLGRLRRNIYIIKIPRIFKTHTRSIHADAIEGVARPQSQLTNNHCAFGLSVPFDLDRLDLNFTRKSDRRYRYYRLSHWAHESVELEIPCNQIVRKNPRYAPNLHPSFGCSDLGLTRSINRRISSL